METLAKRTSSPPEGRNVLFGYQVFRSAGARKLVWVVLVYKHLVPLGPKTSAPKIPTGLLREL
jgi:hypothetical protein